MSKFLLNDLNGSVADFTKYIEINSNQDPSTNAHAYFYCSVAKFMLNNHYGSIADMTKSIEINPRIQMPISCWEIISITSEMSQELVLIGKKP